MIFVLSTNTFPDLYQLRMYQVEEGPRSIGANVTIVSNLTTPCEYANISFYVQNLTEVSVNFNTVRSCMFSFQRYHDLYQRFLTFLSSRPTMRYNKTNENKLLRRGIMFYIGLHMQFNANFELSY